ncbi:MAG: asparagine synthase-related protein, partial [Phreatobacter sp.]
MTPDAYLAIVAPGTDPEHARQMADRAGRDLQLIPMFQSDGLTVLARPGARHHSLGDSGIVIGTMISRGPADSPGERGSRPTDGRQLIASSWGDYIAFLRGPETDAVTVIRAPSGGLPAFRAIDGEVTLISSNVAFLLALTGASPRIDWDFVAHHLAFPHLRAGATGLDGIDELFAGDGTVFTPRGARRVGLWSPWDFAVAERQITDPEEARDAVRRAVNQAVRGLVQPYRSALLELSGGLDSSVLAAALAASGATATAINLVTPGAEGDERSYARATATACGLGLAERDVAGDVDLTAPVPDRLARPGIPAILGPADGLLARLGRESGVDVFVSGTGGDCVFCSPASAAPAADAWRTFGPGRRFLRAVRHVAEIHDTSL